MKRPGDTKARFIALALLLLLPLSAGCLDSPDETPTDSPDPSIEPALEPNIAVSPTTLNFEELAVGDTVTKTLTIQNKGDGDLKVTQLSFSEDASDGFSLKESYVPLTIKPSGSSAIEVVLKPDTKGSLTGSLVVESNDPDSARLSVALVGVVTDEGGTNTDADNDGYYAEVDDCDDTDAEINPGAEDICDEVDNDCDGQVDEGNDADADGTADCVDNDSDGFTELEGDCNDQDSGVYPNAPEVCDGIDSNCDGDADQGQDADGDGTSDCFDDDHDGYSEETGDCNDQNPDQHPDAPEQCNLIDDDCDGQVDEDADFDLDGDGYSACAGDCNDQDANVHPDAAESCNGVDDNCNGEADEGLPVTVYYQDQDGDGYGSSSNSTASCGAPPGYTEANGDCNDENASIYPSAPEQCNGIDDDCDLQVDEGVELITFYQDTDGDGYGNEANTTQACSAPTGYVTDATDCDDTNAAIHPNAPETCNQLDDDCDGQVDDGVTTSTWYKDGDHDGYGDPSQSTQLCSQPSGYVADNTDCNDSREDVNPGASEQCNGVDDNCNGQVDENIVTSTFYQDGDGDGYGNPDRSVVNCRLPNGYVTNADDCNDANAAVNPAATEVCNGIDDNCNTQIDEGVQTGFYPDKDGDGYGGATGAVVYACTAPTGYVSNNQDCDDTKASVNPGAAEVCNQVDDNCNGLIDDGLATFVYHADKDGDGYGDPNTSQTACGRPSGYVQDNTDCNDNAASIHPGATEVCNGIDENCNGQIDDGVITSTWYKDADGDTYGDPATTSVSCAMPSGYVANGDDCNDKDASIHPNATEVCNGVDDDCDAQIDENVKLTWYQDADGDGYGNPNQVKEACSKPSGYVADKTDCNDAAASINPGATEVCNDIDDNCNNQIDEGVATTTWYQDADGDGYGNVAVTKLDCNQPTGYVSNSTDCNDSKASINPGAAEQCNGVDDNCNGKVDDGVATSTWYRDQDGDGYGNASQSTVACSQPLGYVADKTDCNDTSAAINPGATEKCNGIDDNCNSQIDENVQTTFYQDADGDGYGNANKPTTACSAPTGYVSNKTDCDDTNAAINPGATEVCNQIDDNCNGLVDDGVATSTWYQDNDGDNYGNSNVTKTQCSKPAGYVSAKGDCNDANAAINPGATEVCNQIDDNCNGLIDDGVATSTWYQDADGDGYGNPNVSKVQCSAPTGYVSNKTDCDDTKASVNPGATEVCNAIDDNCNGQIDENVKTTWYLDLDGDGYGNSSNTIQACSKPVGYAAVGGDCNDTNPAINPGAAEACNQIDDNCNGQIDEGLSTSTWYQDADGDGYGNANVTKTQCSKPVGYVSNKTDCDDTKASVNPGAAEQCNGIDDNCNGLVDDGITSTTYYQDADNDGYGNPNVSKTACSKPSGYVSQAGDCDDTKAAVNPGAAEVCNAIDDNCNGQIDEGVKTTWYQDNDGDGYGTSTSTQACSKPTGYAAVSGDCNDSNAAVNPGATEVCNNVDDNCNGTVDENVKTTWYQDKDGDGYGTSTTTQACTKPSGYAAVSGDCNDNNAAVNPGATEVCNNIDDNCNTQIDENVKTTWYVDADGDGYGNAASSTQSCTQPSGYVLDKTDCNDNNAAIHPGATEVCNNLDDNCNGTVDEGVKVTYYRDADADGYGSAANTTQACSLPTGYVTNNLDCNDSDPAINPAATEVCNAKDDNCNGVSDEGLSCPDTDNDGDGYTENQGDCNDSSSTVRPVTVDGGYVGTEDGSSAKPYNTIQEGITAAVSSCPLVLVRAYTYKERIDFKGKAITVRSLDGAAATVIDGQAGGTVVTFKTGEKDTSVLDGFTITNGKAAAGGGISITGSTSALVSPIVQNSIIKSNVATGKGGGGLYVLNGAPTIQNNTFSTNSGPTNPSTTGIVAGGAVLLETNGAAKLLSNTFDNNTHLRGGAIGMVGAGAPTLTLNQFTSNKVTTTNTATAAQGGALYVKQSKPVLTDCVFETNTSTHTGGAISAEGVTAGDTVLTLDNVSFSSNKAGSVTVSNDTAGKGGAIYLGRANLNMTVCDFDVNAAGYLGGALYAQDASVLVVDQTSFALNLTANTADTSGGAGGAIYLTGVTASFDQSLFQNNSSGLNGGAMYVTGNTSFTLLDSQFAGNVATSNAAGKGQAGAVFVDASTGVIQGSVFEINAANEGGGAIVFQAANVEMTQNLLYKNTARSKGGALLINPTATIVTPAITNNIFQVNKVTNTNGQGGALYLSPKSSTSQVKADVFNNVFAENEALSQGAGAWIGSDTLGRVMNNIFYSNRTREGLYTSTTGTVPTITFNDGFGNVGNYGGRAPDGTNLQVEPLFQAFTLDGLDNDDFHLQATSPMKNAGNPDAAFNDADGTRNDMGAYGGPDSSW